MYKGKFKSPIDFGTHDDKSGTFPFQIIKCPLTAIAFRVQRCIFEPLEERTRAGVQDFQRQTDKLA